MSKLDDKTLSIIQKIRDVTKTIVVFQCSAYHHLGPRVLYPGVAKLDQTEHVRRRQTFLELRAICQNAWEIIEPLLPPDGPLRNKKTWEKACELERRDVDARTKAAQEIYDWAEVVLVSAALDDGVAGKPAPSVAEFAVWMSTLDKQPSFQSCATFCGVSRQAFNKSDRWGRYRDARTKWTRDHQSTIPRGSKAKDGHMEAEDDSADDRSAAD